MQDSKNLDHHDEVPNKNSKTESIEIKDNDQKTRLNTRNQNSKGFDFKNNPTNFINKESNEIIKDKTLEENKKPEVNSKLNSNEDETKNNINKESNEIIKDKTLEENKKPEVNSKLTSNVDETKNNIKKESDEIIKDKTIEENKKPEVNSKLNSNEDETKNNIKKTSTTIPLKAKTKPVKEPPIEKKPFLEFVNDYLIPEIKNEFKLKGKEVNKINLQKTNRPIAEDLCWVIYCEINDTCNFWLSFEKDDITSLKSFSLCKNYEKPSIIESFLIDEKKITLKLIISRILQRLNGQKLIGAN